MHKLTVKIVISIFTLFFCLEVGLEKAGADIPQRKVVAPTSAPGVDCTSIQTCINSITPTSSSPWVIDVMPGTYTENITMKGYIHLRGAGREVTTIQPTASNPIITITNISNVAISGFWISRSTTGTGLHIEGSSSVTVFDNTISFGAVSGTVIEISNASPAISRNDIIGGNSGIMILSTGSSSAVIKENTITGVAGTNNGPGILNYQSPVIMGNTITGKANGIVDNSPLSYTISGNTITGSPDNGILSVNPAAVFMVINNRITGNSGGDISVYSGGLPRVSHNVFDTIPSGITSTRGGYNVNSDGTVKWN